MVGPNGSGKSNVIDAMLFVFAKRAKQLRLNKLSELIHNSTHHQNLPYAKVDVHFAEIIDKVRQPPRPGRHLGRSPSSPSPLPSSNLALSLILSCLPQPGEEYELIPGSEFVVTRTADRDSKSDYFVDGRRSSMADVTRLLKGKGIDLDNNRFLILQGEVEQISMMKPKGNKASGRHPHWAPLWGASRCLEPCRLIWSGPAGANALPLSSPSPSSSLSLSLLAPLPSPHVTGSPVAGG